MNVVSRTLSVHKEHEVLLKLEAAGLNDKLAQKIIDSKNNELAKKLVEFIEKGGSGPTASQVWAREIMGHNFFGPEEAMKHFGISPSKRELSHLNIVPFTKESLRSCKDTHILVATFQLSILDLLKRVTGGLCYCHVEPWYKNRGFAKDRGRVEWHLVRKTPIEYSIGKTWAEQQLLLSLDEEPASARVMFYTALGHFLTAGEKILENAYVRCLEYESGGNRICVGDFGNEGLRINSYCSNSSRSHLGLSAIRKMD